jgi:hypothetical protein
MDNAANIKRRARKFLMDYESVYPDLFNRDKNMECGGDLRTPALHDYFELTLLQFDEFGVVKRSFTYRERHVPRRYLVRVDERHVGPCDSADYRHPVCEELYVGVPQLNSLGEIAFGAHGIEEDAEFTYLDGDVETAPTT